MKNTKLAALVALMLGAAGSANAAIVSFADRATWEGAAGGTPSLFEDFNSFTANTTALPQSVFGGAATLSATATADQPYIDGPPLSNAGDVNGTAYLDALINGGDFVSFVFDTPVFSWGADINPHDNSFDAVVTIFLDSVDSGSYSLPGSNQTVFVGFVSDVAFQTLALRAPTGPSPNTAYHGIDNVGSHPFEEAPAPGPLALIAIGLFGMWRAGRSHRGALARKS
jgi:hypothetical protein